MEGSWYLRKHEDGGLFGPLDFDQLTRWASTARIAPLDLVSSDQESWVKAPMLGELGMDWLIEITGERLYGPTTLGAIGEFLRLSEITNENYVINACDGSRRRIGELLTLFPTIAEEHNGDTAAASGTSINFADRIRDLERSLHEERHALHESEARYRDLEQRYNELLAQRDTIL